MKPMIEGMLIKHYRDPRLWMMLADHDEENSCEYLIKAGKYGDQAGYLQGYASM